jgi:hypothetical protein
MAGYSKTPLAGKLGLKPGMKVRLANAPAGYSKTLGKLPPGIVEPARPGAGSLDFIQFFTKSRAELEKALPAMLKSLAPDGMLWVSWPKKAAKVPTDMTEDVVRAVALPKGLVDVKVCAVDDVWSGLKLVRRLENRRPL